MDLLSILLLVTMLGASSCIGRSPSPSPPTGSGSITETTPPITVSGKPPRNPFGVFFNPELYSLQARIQLAKELGAYYFRSFPALVPTWNGHCDECAGVRRAGLHFVLTIRNATDYTGVSSAPTDIGAFKETVGQIIDAYRPALVVVENEENTPQYFTSGPDGYATELQAVCEVAHSKGIKCANGGILGQSAAWLLYFHYLDEGDRSQAESFLQQAFTAGQPNLQLGQTVRRVTLSFIQRYKQAGADYMNFHWYAAGGSTMEAMARYLERLTGLPVITNEMGQRDENTATTESLIDAVVALKLPIAVWFSVDARLSKALIDPNGSLRPTGQAFRSYIQRHYAS